MDINQELEKLIEKYNLDRHYPAYRKSKQACEFLRKWIQELADDEKEFLFIGMDDRALKLINRWKIQDNINVLLIKNVDDLQNYINDLKIKKIYIVSFTRTTEILHWLWRNNCDAESVYDVLENEHIYLQMEFYRFFTPIKVTKELNLHKWMEDEITPDGASIVLLEYYYQKRKLEYIISEKDIKRINEKLFFLSICMRNFLEAERILSVMKEPDNYKQFWNELSQLLLKVKKKLQLKNQKDLIVYWIDALPYMYAEKLTYLNEKSDHSIIFHNAYTVTPWTAATCMTMFCKMREIDDLGYRVNQINLSNSPILRDIEEQGYLFNLFSEDFIGIFDTKYSPNKNARWSNTCSEVYWDLLDQILQSEQKTVYLVHTGMETHEPVLSVRKNRFDMKYNNEVQIDELDAQLRFYDKMLGNGFYRIFMSDHGSSTMSPVNRTHILFQVYYSGWDKKETYKIFSLLDFDKIVHQILIGQEIEDSLWERKYAPIQSMDIYNRMLIQRFIKRKGLLTSYIAYKGLATEEYTYVKFKVGKDVLIKRSDADKDLEIASFGDSHNEDVELFKELRKEVGGFPKELDIDSKFEYSKYLYLVYENVEKTVNEVAKLINKKLAEYPNDSIALRMGGNHTYQIYTLLNECVKKKICGIIDKDKNCKCSSLGVPIVGDVQELFGKAKTVILSSFLYLDELKEEAQKYYDFLEIIDIYEYMEKCGYEFNNVFWWGKDSDWNVGFPMI